MNLLDIHTPGEIFSGDINCLKKEFDELVKKYHPDKNKSLVANDEFIKLKELYEDAKNNLRDGFWEGKNTLNYFPYKTKFFRKKKIEIGYMYIGNNHVTFKIDAKYKGLWENAISKIENFKFASSKMKKEMEKYLPRIKASKSLSNYCFISIEKTPDLILLGDVDSSNIKFWDKHVTWILSSLYNMMCYLEFSGITHNDISLDTYFISAKYHSGALLGGWWFSCKKGTPMHSIPMASYECLPMFMKKNKVADHSLDKELVRALGRELLGDRGGTKLSDKLAPRPIINWLKCATSKPAIEEYKLWDKTIIDGYGEKRFIPLDIKPKGSS
jgi:hypothetical protein